jgi:hypothetical protein
MDPLLSSSLPLTFFPGFCRGPDGSMEVLVEHFVSMPRLPEGLRFPPEFSGRISHDTARGRLAFRGFMSKADFDRLSRLSDDWSYRRPLEDLFRQCMPEEPRSPVFARLASLFSLGA